MPGTLSACSQAPGYQQQLLLLLHHEQRQTSSVLAPFVHKAMCKPHHAAASCKRCMLLSKCCHPTFSHARRMRTLWLLLFQTPLPKLLQ
jgi:hypothetical protein